jgi:two-component sensor histidine kinase
MTTTQEGAVEAVSFLSDTRAVDEGLRLGGVGVWRWKIDTEQLEWTRNLERVHHLPSGSFDGTLSSFQRDLHPDDAAVVWQQIVESIETGAPYRAVYRTAPRPDTPELWIETSGGVTVGGDGSRYLTGVCLDVTERIRNEIALKGRLAQQNAVARFGSFALNERDFQAILDRAVLVAAEVLEVPLTKILQFADSADHLVLRAGVGWAEGLVGHGTVGTERASQAGYTLLANEPVIVRDLPSETRFDGPQLLHDYKVRSGISVVIPGSEVRPFGVFGIHAREPREFDRTDAEFVLSLANIVAGAGRQVAAADHQTLLVREMAHRAGNMLQLVNSIAGQTFNADTDPQIARKSFSDRLSALARSNYVISRGGWTSTRFSELVDEATKPFGGRITTAGRDILLPPELCFDMGLVLHELATNSMKYGALGTDHGVIDVRWAIRWATEGARTFSLSWEDSVSVQETPVAGTGFGSRLVSALVERKWNGTLSVSTTPHFSIRMELPVLA